MAETKRFLKIEWEHSEYFGIAGKSKVKNYRLFQIFSPQLLLLNLQPNEILSTRNRCPSDFARLNLYAKLNV